MTSLHERRRQALNELEAHAHLPLVARAALALGIDPAYPPLTLRAALRPGPGPYVEMVLALGPRPGQAVSVECWESPPEGVDRPFLARVGSIGWVTVAPITDDPVAATAAGLAGAETRLVRYHRGLRATVRVDRPSDLPGCPVAFAKVFSDHRGAARHEVAQQLVAAAGTGLLAFRVPRPAGYDGSRFVLWQHEVTGVPATGRLTGREGPELARAMGAALGSLHTSGLAASRTITASTQLARAGRNATEAARLVPGLGERIIRLLESVERVADSVGAGPGVPIHGSPDPSQWLVDEASLPGLLDFDRFAHGEPETDLACFLVEVAALGPSQFSEGVSEGFLAGYGSVAGGVDPDSLRRQCTLRRIGKVVRAARALRADGDQRAGRVLAAAERAAAHPSDAIVRAG